MLGSEVVEDEQFRFTHGGEELIIDDGRVGRKGGTQMIEQFGDDCEKDKGATRKVLIGNGGCEVCFSATVFADEDEPSLGILGIFKRYLIGFLYARNARIKVFEALVTKGVEVGHFAQLSPPFLFALGFFAFARDRLAEIRMSVGDIDAQVACSLANGAVGRG